MDNSPLFSVVVIARNESKTLPRLVASLKEFQDRGGEIVVLDTGSEDDTVRIARDLGCVVTSNEVHRAISGAEAEQINQTFQRWGDAPIVLPGDSYFDFSAARNLAASLATHAWVAMPDCDEQFTRLDIDKINAAIREGVQQFEYTFVFAHDSAGKPLVQFRHCKFYNRTAMEWTGIVHEVLTGDAKRAHVDYIQLEHWQNPSTNRGQYLTGLALDCLRNPDNDRNSHYFARELMWSGRLESATEEFCRHIDMNRWPAERAQSSVFIGDIRRQQGDYAWAVMDYFAAWTIDGTRREPLIRIAEHFYRERDAQRTRTFAEAALTIPLNDYYGNNMRDYGAYPHEMAYWACHRLGDKEAAEKHWRKALDLEPTNSLYLTDAQFFLTLPKVDIILPHIPGTREAELTRLEETIQANANYPDFSVHVEKDHERAGCPKTFNRGVRNTSAPLIMFLGDDCEPQPDFLIQAVLALLKFNEFLEFSEDCLVALNDGMWNGELATHFLTTRRFLDSLPWSSQPFHESFYHVGCDNLLTGWAKSGGCYHYAPLARVTHNTIDDEVRAQAWDPAKVFTDRQTLRVLCDAYQIDPKLALCPE